MRRKMMQSLAVPTVDVTERCVANAYSVLQASSQKQAQGRRVNC